MGKYFGTDGFRGEANVNLTVHHAFIIGSYFGKHACEILNSHRKIVIGQDTRISSDMFVAALAAGVTSAGCDACILGVVPTPCVAYITQSYDFDYGIMVSASHNPYYDNGIKVLNSYGEKLNDSVISDCEAYIDKGTQNAYLNRDYQIGKCIDFKEFKDIYINHLVSCVENKFDNFRIAIDCSNGSSSLFAEELFSRLGSQVSVINNKPNGLNINDNCGSTHMQQLCDFVRAGTFDIGFAYDGDADRCLAVDCNGNIIDGDQIMFLCARKMLKDNTLSNNTLVTTVMSNFGLYKALDKCNISYEKTNVGDRFVYENMQRNNHSLGGEQSGHIIFSKYATTGDGMLTSIIVLDSLIYLKEDICEAVNAFCIYPQILKNVTVVDKFKVMNDKDVIDCINEINANLSDEGRILVRPSGTEPYIRVMSEASNEDICNEVVDKIINLFRKKGYLV